MKPEINELADLLPKIKDLSEQINDLIEGWGDSDSHVSIDLSLLQNYLESYTQFLSILSVIRSNPPSYYLANSSESALIISAIMCEKGLAAQAERCLDLAKRINRYIDDLNN